MSMKQQIAYFSMEIALHPEIHTYSGGLGVLAGDTLRSAADLKVPMVAVTLVHRRGYFRQAISQDGRQSELPDVWDVERFLEKMPTRLTIPIEDRAVVVEAWRFMLTGVDAYTIPVYLLDTDIAENSPQDRLLSHFLYGGDEHYRLCQEVILGIGGVRMLEALGHRSIRKYHMNEGHSALLTVGLLEDCMRKKGTTLPSAEDIESVRAQCVFTTHTPVPAGHDQFPLSLANKVLGSQYSHTMKDVFCCDDKLNMTYLAMNMSHYINGVAKRHGEVSKNMFSQYKIDAITNGVHAATWTSPAFQKLFDKYIPEWRQDNFSLRYALSISPQEVWEAHRTEKNRLLQYIETHYRTAFDREALTIGFARRATAYKRLDLIFKDIARLQSIVSRHGPIQLVFGGKAHPKDHAGKELIERVYRAQKSLNDLIRVIYLENYDVELGKLITAGVDVWLNTPEAPLEASGTSGMKAALNGVPSFSILDGWWVEGCIEGVTGWAIGNRYDVNRPHIDHSQDANMLYDKLEQQVIPTFYEKRHEFIEIMSHAIALNGSFFNTERMVQQYIHKAYFH